MTRMARVQRWPALSSTACIAALLIALAGCAPTASDPLPSWNDGFAKQAIVTFVARVTEAGSPDYVPPAERIAVFDNDGTLWAEQPLYFQTFFIFDRIRALAPQHSEWTDTEPFASVLRGDPQAAVAGGDAALLPMALATQSGMTTGEFRALAGDWIATARHPATGRLFTEMAYLPMLELLSYLRANGFKSFLVSGGGVEFMRAWSERVYGIPPEHVIGSSLETRFELRDGVPAIVRLPELAYRNVAAGKPAAIQHHIGRRPIAAFGNSDDDLPMLQWTCGAPGPRFCLFVHHTDADREWAYDRRSDIGRLDRGLDAARANGWTVVSIRADWARVFAFEPSSRAGANE